MGDTAVLHLRAPKESFTRCVAILSTRAASASSPSNRSATSTSGIVSSGESSPSLDPGCMRGPARLSPVRFRRAGTMTTRFFLLAVEGTGGSSLVLALPLPPPNTGPPGARRGVLSTTEGPSPPTHSTSLDLSHAFLQGGRSVLGFGSSGPRDWDAYPPSRAPFPEGTHLEPRPRSSWDFSCHGS